MKPKKKMSLVKQLLTFFMCVIMVITAVPTYALAETPQETLVPDGNVSSENAVLQDSVEPSTTEEQKYTVTYTDGVEDEEIFADQIYSDLDSGSETPAFVGNPSGGGICL